MKNESILIVEDELIIALSLKKDLEKQEYNVLPIFSDADEAIEKALEHEPELIIMDILLNSNKNGVEAAQEISQSIDTKFIFLTGNEYLMQETKGKIISDYQVLSKPATEEELKTSINNMIS